MANVNSEYLLGLARDRSTESRQLLAESITDLFGGESRSISDRERVLMYEIMHQMVLDTEMSVRKIVAARLAEAPGAPPDTNRLNC